MENKKGFILYADTIHTVEKLPDEIAGKLFKHVLEYVNDREPESDDILVQIAFEPIKQQLKRDLEKWNGIREKRSIAGQKSAEIRAQRKEEQKPTKSTSVQIVEQVPTNPTVKESVKVNVKVSVINRKDEFKNSIQPFIEKYDSNLLNEFFLYWTEKNTNGVKMKFEFAKNQPFDVARRLVTWKKNEKKFGGDKNQSNVERVMKMNEDGKQILNQFNFEDEQ